MTGTELENILSAACLFLAIAGALVLMIAPKDDDARRRIGLGFFAGGMGGLAMLFVLKNPEILESVQRHIALALIGMVIAFFSILRFLKK
jgi:hypothetical protein